MSEDYESIVGTLEKILYKNPENGFIIGTFNPQNSLKLITVKGIVFNTYEHENLHLRGFWENHKIYGRQFSIREFMTIEPKSLDGMIRYLSSKVFKGVGEKTAKRIVKKFGEDTFKIIDNSPELLSQVEGVGKKQKNSLLNSWEDQKGLRDVMTFLRGVGISYSYAQLIFSQNGLNSIPIIKANPYQLTNISGIGYWSNGTNLRRLKEVIEKGLSLDPQYRPQKSKQRIKGMTNKEREKANIRLKQLKEGRKDLGQELKLDPSLLWPTSSLARLSRFPESFEEEFEQPEVRNWQIKEFGDSISQNALNL